MVSPQSLCNIFLTVDESYCSNYLLYVVIISTMFKTQFMRLPIRTRAISHLNSIWIGRLAFVSAWAFNGCIGLPRRSMTIFLNLSIYKLNGLDVFQRVSNWHIWGWIGLGFWPSPKPKPSDSKLCKQQQ